MSGIVTVIPGIAFKVHFKTKFKKNFKAGNNSKIQGSLFLPDAKILLPLPCLKIILQSPGAI
jgi:hypothetical protein